jgi:hypothetical protein
VKAFALAFAISVLPACVVSELAIDREHIACERDEHCPEEMACDVELGLCSTAEPQDAGVPPDGGACIDAGCVSQNLGP